MDALEVRSTNVKLWYTLSIVSSLWPPPRDSGDYRNSWKAVTYVVLSHIGNSRIYKQTAIGRHTAEHLLGHLPPPGLPGQLVTKAALPRLSRKSSLSLKSPHDFMHLSPRCVPGPTQAAEETENLSNRETCASRDML